MKGYFFLEGSRAGATRFTGSAALIAAASFAHASQ
jgi:hypothetical protein